MRKLFLVLLLTVGTFANIGTIMTIQGKASVNRADKSVKATNGMNLFEGDQIITQNKTKVQIMLNDNTAITIGPHSAFSFEEYLYDGTDSSSVTMKATRGFFRSVTGKIGKLAPERFKVKTNLATIGVRGTDFSAQLQDTTAVYKCYSGEIVVSFEGNKQSVIAGDMLQLQLDGSTVKVQPIKALKTISKSKVSANNIIHTEALSDISGIKHDIKDIKFDCQIK